MTDNKKHIAILGSTGSIGTQALEVIEANPSLFVVEVLSANSNSTLLIEQALKFKPNAVVIVDENKYQEVFDILSPKDIKVYAGKDSLSQVVEMDSIDMVLTALVGYSGLKPTISAIKAKKNIALSEQRNFGGCRFFNYRTSQAKRGKYSILLIPNIQQFFNVWWVSFITLLKKYTLPLRVVLLEVGINRGLTSVTKEQALKHPNWEMGAKITIDSASLMNKGLEVIEAKWLFGLKPEQIDVIVHPTIYNSLNSAIY